LLNGHFGNSLAFINTDLETNSIGLVKSYKKAETEKSCDLPFRIPYSVTEIINGCPNQRVYTSGSSVKKSKIQTEQVLYPVCSMLLNRMHEDFAYYLTSKLNL